MITHVAHGTKEMDRERKGEKFIPYYYIPQRIIVFILLLHIITTFNPFIVLQSEFSTLVAVISQNYTPQFPKTKMKKQTLIHSFTLRNWSQ